MWHWNDSATIHHLIVYTFASAWHDTPTIHFVRIVKLYFMQLMVCTAFNAANKVKRSHELFTHVWLTCSLHEIRNRSENSGSDFFFLAMPILKNNRSTKKNTKEDIIELAYNFLPLFPPKRLCLCVAFVWLSFQLLVVLTPGYLQDARRLMLLLFQYLEKM